MDLLCNWIDWSTAHAMSSWEYCNFVSRWFYYVALTDWHKWVFTKFSFPFVEKWFCVWWIKISAQLNPIKFNIVVGSLLGHHKVLSRTGFSLVGGFCFRLLFCSAGLFPDKSRAYEKSTMFVKYKFRSSVIAMVAVCVFWNVKWTCLLALVLRFHYSTLRFWFKGYSTFLHIW